MLPDEDFQRLLARARAGDQEAAATLVRQYEPEIRRVVRVRLSDPRLRRVLDSVDVCQSVLANFFIRVSAGEFDLKEPGELLRLLSAMARNKVLDVARRQTAQRRDARRVAGSDALSAIAARQPSPSEVVAGQELLQRVRDRLTEEERHLADQRALGREWGEIAREQQAQPDALRKKLSRALDRVTRELGLEEIHHG